MHRKASDYMNSSRGAKPMVKRLCLGLFLFAFPGNLSIFNKERPPQTHDRTKWANERGGVIPCVRVFCTATPSSIWSYSSFFV